MVIDESGLEKALKAAYKGEGYKVAVKTNRGGGLEMCFAGDGWEAAVDRDNVPRKVLGMIAEHLGTLPELGEAFQINKDESQTEIFQMSLGADEQPDEQMQIVRTKITYMGYPVWQRKGDQKTFMVSPKLEQLFDNYLKIYMTEGNSLFAKGMISQVKVEPMQLMAEAHTVLSHLSKLNWT